MEAGSNARERKPATVSHELINEREGTVIEQGSLVDGSLTLEDPSYTKSSLKCAEKSKRNQRVKF